MKLSRHFLTSSTAEMKVANLGTERHEEIGLVMVLEEEKKVPNTIKTPEE